MALTDIVNGVRRLARPLALGLAVYGCGGAEPGSGGKPEEPTYEGMCEDLTEFKKISCANATVDRDYVKEVYQYCLDRCEPDIKDLRHCASDYCELETRAFCTEHSYGSAYQACMESFNVEPFRCENC